MQSSKVPDEGSVACFASEEAPSQMFVPGGGQEDRDAGEFALGDTRARLPTV
jgi:hypothetical protein